MRTVPQSRQHNLIVQELKDELLVYDLTTNKAFCLNPTSAMIYQLCDGKHSVSDISREISKKLEQPVTEDLVWLAIDQFKEDNLLSNNQEIEIKFDGLSRREVIRKVGFASMIALPVISSLVAPTVAMAQSCVASRGTVTGTGTTLEGCIAAATARCCSGTNFAGDGGCNSDGCTCTISCS